MHRCVVSGSTDDRPATRSRERTIGEPRAIDREQMRERNAGDGRRFAPASIAAPAVVYWSRARKAGAGRGRRPVSRGSRTEPNTRDAGNRGGDGSPTRIAPSVAATRSSMCGALAGTASTSRAPTSRKPAASRCHRGFGKNLFVVGRLGAARHHEQLAGARNLVRDAAERHAVQKAVDQPVRIVGLDQLLNRRRLGEQIADGNAPVAGLRAGDADRHASGGHGVCADDDERVIRPEPLADLSAGALPIKSAKHVG